MVYSTNQHPSTLSHTLSVYYVHLVWKGVGEESGGGGGVELCFRPYSAGVLHSVSDQIQNLKIYFTTPNKIDQ